MTVYVVKSQDDTEGEQLITIVTNKDFAERIADWNGGESWVEDWDLDKEEEFYEKYVK